MKTANAAEQAETADKAMKRGGERERTRNEQDGWPARGDAGSNQIRVLEGREGIDKNEAEREKQNKKEVNEGKEAKSAPRAGQRAACCLAPATSGRSIFLFSLLVF